MVFQVPDEAGAEVAHIGLDLPDVLPEGIQLGDYDLITVGAAVPVAPADYSPCHDDDQDSDGADYLGQGSEALHLDLLFRFTKLRPIPRPTNPGEGLRVSRSREHIDQFASIGWLVSSEIISVNDDDVNH